MQASKIMSKYPGRFCQEVKLSCEKLLGSQPLLQVKADKITNGLVLELVRLRKAKRLPWESMIGWIIQLYGRCWPTEPQPAELTLIKTFSAVSGKHRNLVLKQNSEKTQQFII